MELTNTRLVNASEALSMLEKRQKEGELGYEQQNTLTHLQAVAKVGVKEAAALEKELNELGFLNEKQVVMLTSIVPKTADEVRFVLTQEKNDLTPEQLKQVLGVVKPYAGKGKKE